MAVSNDIMCVLFPLQAAGNAVKRASDNLVRAAQKAAFGKADDDDVVVKTKFVGGIAQVCDETQTAPTPAVDTVLTQTQNNSGLNKMEVYLSHVTVCV